MLDWWIYNDPEDSPGGDSGDGEETPDGEEGSSGDPGGQEELVPRAELAKTNAEAAKWRKQLREAQKEVEALKEGQKTEREKEQDKLKKAEADLLEARQQVSMLRVRVLAEEVGIMREARADAAKLLDLSGIEDPTDDAQITAALKDLVKDRPYLLGTTGGADGGAGGRKKPAHSDMNAIIRGR